MKTSLLKGLLKTALGLGLLAYVIASNWAPADGGLGLASALERPLRVGPLVLAGLILSASLLITFVRWYVLVRAQDLPFTVGNAVRLGMVGYFFNTLLPGSVGGDLVKAVAIVRTQSRRTIAVATVLLDRAIGLWALVWLVALLGLAFTLADDALLAGNAGLRAVVRTSWVVAGATAGVWVLLGFLPQWRAEKFAWRLGRIPRIGHNFAEFWRAIWMYRRRGGAVSVALLMSLVSHTGCVLTFHIASRAFSDPAADEHLPTLTEHFLVVPLGMAIQALFPAPGGVGGGEFGYGKLYALLGRPEAAGVLASLAQRVLTWVVGVIGYLIYLQMRPALPAPESVEDAAEAPAVAASP